MSGKSGIGAERLGYEMAVANLAPDPPAPLYERTAHIEGRDAIVHKATELILAFKKGEDVDENAWEYVAANVDSHLDHLNLLRMAMYLAKQDTRYWGVDDPNEKRYCHTCRTAVKVESFRNEEGDHDKCASCRQDKTRGKTLVEVPEGMRRCYACKKNRAEESFYYPGEYVGGNGRTYRPPEGGFKLCAVCRVGYEDG